LLLLLGAARPAGAHDWLGEWRAMRAEYQAEFDQARALDRLDCAGLSAYVALENRLANQRIHAEYHRPMPRARPAAAPAGGGTAPPPVPAAPAPR
jgi:hypothetical protein